MAKRKLDLFEVPEAYYDEETQARVLERRVMVAEKYGLTYPTEITVFEIIDRMQGENGLSMWKVSYLARCIIEDLREDGSFK